MSNFVGENENSKATNRGITIRPIEVRDHERVLDIFLAVVRAGDTFANDPLTTREQAKKFWIDDPAHVMHVAEVDGRVVGSFLVKTNQPGLGDHVSNGGFMVDPECRSRGVGYKMGAFAIELARKLGYKAMQFNFVVSSNERAVALWKKLGFQIIGVCPKAFRHQKLGLVDTYIMHQFL